MNAVYILGNGSRYNNEELRYSLRTLQAHAKNLEKVYVIGENPFFLSKEVEYHYVPEAQGNREYCISQKVMKACEIVKGDFALMNDDYFFTRNFDLDKYPYYCKGTLNRTHHNIAYRESLHNTYNYLLAKGFTQTHFDVHTPIIYNSDKFLALKEHFEESRKMRYGFVVRSIYCNVYGIEGVEYRDVKIEQLRTYLDLRRIESTNCFSCSDMGWERGIGNYLRNYYSKKSKYEK